MLIDMQIPTTELLTLKDNDMNILNLVLDQNRTNMLKYLDIILTDEEKLKLVK
jgi:hypothetical protein